jgi:transposase-like protein
MISKRTPARMARLVAQWRASGASAASFARRHHIPAWTFWYWCRKLSAESRMIGSDGTPLATFVPVRMAVEPDTPAIEIVLSGGEHLHVRPGASAELVRAVITALRSPC